VAHAFLGEQKASSKNLPWGQKAIAQRKSVYISYIQTSIVVTLSTKKTTFSIVGTKTLKKEARHLRKKLKRKSCVETRGSVGNFLGVGPPSGGAWRNNILATKQPHEGEYVRGSTGYRAEEKLQGSLTVEYDGHRGGGSQTGRL